MISINDFKLEKIIGKGSYGIVYSAKNIHSKEIYAIKKISLSNLSHYEKKSVINELKILACHNCPYIIQYYSSFIHLNDIYIITEYAQSGDLLQLIKTHKKNITKFHEDEIWKYFIQICIGLQYLHKNNIIHRDIKSANIFVDKDNNIKLGDFGIVKILQTYMMYAQTQIGTPLYMGPEIYKRQRYNSKIDVWSLGCVLYELMTLKQPFTANNMVDLKYKIYSGNYNKVTQNYSLELKQLLTFLLNINPHRRYSIDNILNIQSIKNKMHLIDYNPNKDIIIKPLFNEHCIIPRKNSDWNIIVKKYNKTLKPYISNSPIKKPVKTNKYSIVVDNKKVIESNKPIIESNKPIIESNKPIIESNKNIGADNINYRKNINEQKFINNKLLYNVDQEIELVSTDINNAKKQLDIKIAQLEYLKKKRANIINTPDKPSDIPSSKPSAIPSSKPSAIPSYKPSYKPSSKPNEPGQIKKYLPYNNHNYIIEDSNNNNLQQPYPIKPSYEFSKIPISNVNPEQNLLPPIYFNKEHIPIKPDKPPINHIEKMSHATPEKRYISKDFYDNRPKFISPKNKLIIKIGSKHENNNNMNY